jgi:cell pole-organizing protein PopZ
MTQPAKAQEPSMEEILASIRRIIADDDATKTVQKPDEAVQPPPAPSRPAAPVRPPSPPPSPAPSPAPRVPDPILTAEPEADVGPADGSVADQSADILDLTESMASAVQPAPPAGPNPEPSPMSGTAFRTIDGNFDVSYEEAAERPAVPQRPMGESSAQLLSSTTSAAVDSAFNTLAQTVLVQNARTLEDLVREMLRPLLKAWLDDNLPAVVERMVRAEIERVSRGR